MMLKAVLLAGAATIAMPALAQQQPIAPSTAGRISASQPLATVTGATAASRVKSGSSLETRPSGIIAATGGGLLADRLNADAGGGKDASPAKIAKKKPAAALGASLATDQPVLAATATIPDVDANVGPGDRRPSAVIVRRPPPVAEPKRKN